MMADIRTYSIGFNRLSADYIVHWQLRCSDTSCSLEDFFEDCKDPVDFLDSVVVYQGDADDAVVYV